MEKDRLIRSVRREQKVYYVTNRGGDRICRNGMSISNKSRVTHALMRNELFIRLGKPKDWRKEVPINKEGKVYIVADAMFTKGERLYFVEVDNEQTMRTNEEKIRKYAEVFRLLYRQNGNHPTLLWYSLSDKRKEKLRKVCEKAKIKYEIY